MLAYGEQGAEGTLGRGQADNATVWRFANLSRLHAVSVNAATRSTAAFRGRRTTPPTAARDVFAARAVQQIRGQWDAFRPEGRVPVLKCQRTTWVNQGPWGRAELYVCVNASSLPPGRQRHVGKLAYGGVNLPQNGLANTPHANSQGSQRSPRTCGVLGRVSKMHCQCALGGTGCGISRSLLLKSCPDVGLVDRSGLACGQTTSVHLPCARTSHGLVFIRHFSAKARGIFRRGCGRCRPVPREILCAGRYKTMSKPSPSELDMRP